MKLPEMVYKPAFAVTRASHVVIRVRDLQASRAITCISWVLRLVTRTGIPYGSVG